MSAKQAEARVIQERLKKIDEGADDIFNNLPEAKKLGAEFAKIINSPVGKRIGEKIQKWEELNRQGELEGLMDEEERQAFKRYEYITGEFRKMYDAEIEKVKQELAHLNGKLSVLAEELKKKQDTFGKEAIDKLRN
jgi:peptidoglycan hydrolase CwlO-like protein